MRKKTALSLLLSLLLLLCSCALAAPDTLEATFLDVGKADAILITAGDYAVLIDAGPRESAGILLDALAQRGVMQLDMMIITHFDRDHVGGAYRVLREVPVRMLIDADYEADSGPYERYLRAIESTGVFRTRLAQQMFIPMGEMAFTLYPSPVEDGKANDLSVLVSLLYGEHSFFFAADAEEALIDAVLGAGVEPHTVLKVPHHGRWKDNLGAFLDALQPRIAVITDSEEVRAADSVVALLADRGIEVYHTRFGDVTVYSDGKELSVVHLKQEVFSR